MQKQMKHVGILAAVLALSLVAAACGGDETPGGEMRPIRPRPSPGRSRSPDRRPCSRSRPSSREIFSETNPDVAISVDGPGTGDGFELFCNGETDISDASRPIEPDEGEGLQEERYRVHRARGRVGRCDRDDEPGELERVVPQRRRPLRPVRSGVRCRYSWAAADPLASEVGGTGGFLDAPGDHGAWRSQAPTMRSSSSRASRDIALEQGVPEDEAAALRKDYTASPNDNVIIHAMEGSPSALGFVGFAFAEEAGDAVKEIQVDGGSGCVSPSAETIADGSYPLSRSLYIYVSSEAAARPRSRPTSTSTSRTRRWRPVGWSRTSVTSPFPPSASRPAAPPGSRPQRDRRPIAGGPDRQTPSGLPREPTPRVR